MAVGGHASDLPNRLLRALGGAVVARREELGFTQEEVEHRSRLDRTYISGIERGVRNPTVRSLLKLAQALETTPATLLKHAEKRSRLGAS